MITLALDLGTNCGWARSGPGFVTESGVWRLKTSQEDRPGERYLRFRQRLLPALRKTDRVVSEHVVGHSSTEAAHVYGGFRALLLLECELRRIPVRWITVHDLKRWATGRATADKDEMVWAARNRGWNPSSHDEADALFILDWALRGGADV